MFTLLNQPGPEVPCWKRRSADRYGLFLILKGIPPSYDVSAGFLVNSLHQVNNSYIANNFYHEYNLSFIVHLLCTNVRITFIVSVDLLI